MRGIVDRRAVQQDERLIRAAAANVEAAGEIGGGLDAGQELERAKDVGLQHGGQILNLGSGDLGDAEVGFGLALAGDRELAYGHVLRLQREAQRARGTGFQRNGLPGRLVPDVGGHDGVLARRER